MKLIRKICLYWRLEYLHMEIETFVQKRVNELAKTAKTNVITLKLPAEAFEKVKQWRKYHIAYLRVK